MFRSTVNRLLTWRMICKPDCLSSPAEVLKTRFSIARACSENLKFYISPDDIMIEAQEGYVPRIDLGPQSEQDFDRMYPGKRYEEAMKFLANWMDTPSKGDEEQHGDEEGL